MLLPFFESYTRMHSSEGCSATERAGAELWFMKMQRQVKYLNVNAQPSSLDISVCWPANMSHVSMKRDARRISRIAAA